MARQPPVQRHVLTAYADVAAADSAFLDQPPGHEFGRIDPDGKTDSLGGKNHGGVDADDFAT